jgi:CubicO group peptidase (beta-lactamase class C family)/peptidoglycan/LPS O-acetylase OafA/YrhL
MQPSPAEGQRNSFLDALRAVAILRVVLWHTYGFAWLSYLIASMPAMFFVAGSLMSRSLRHRGGIEVQVQRFRRLLIPLWLLAFVAISIMLLYQRQTGSAAADFDTLSIAWWVFPIWDPTGSEWGITWWTALWYLRCLTWLLLVSPLLFWLWRRVGPLLLVLPLAGLTLTEGRLQSGAPLPWQLQDAALYSFFWLLGFAYDDGRFNRFGSKVRAGLCLAAAGAAAAWVFTNSIPGGIVNASYPLHLLVGLAWLFGALTLEQTIGAIARHPRADAVIYWVNERALSIYLWQAAGLFVMYQLLWTQPYSGTTRTLLALPIVASVTLLAVLTFGWVEDVAAGRRLRFWPARGDTSPRSRRLILTAGSGAIAAVVVAVLALTTSFTTDVHVLQGPSQPARLNPQAIPPSGAGLRLRTQQAQILPAEQARSQSDEEARGKSNAPTGPLPPVSSDDLQAELEAWTLAWEISGATVTLRRTSGEAWTGTVGFYEDGTPFISDEPYWIASLTKTFTTALVMRLVESGDLELDDSVDTYFPEFPHAGLFTVRNLIQHTSGLVAGDEIPIDALATAAEEGLQFEPGTSSLYSRAAYYLLGLLIEDKLARPYSLALRQELLDPLGLASTFMDEEIQPLSYSTHPFAQGIFGYPGAVSYLIAAHQQAWQGDYRGVLWSSGGLWSTTSDLARWAANLWGSEQVVSPTSIDSMTTFLGPEFDFAGLGTFAFCPCWMEGDRLRAERWGHLGATGVLEFDPADQVAIATHTSGSILDDNRMAALDDLSRRLRDLTRGRELI